MKSLIFIACIVVVNSQATKLGRYNVDTSRVTMSGFSSGGTFAQAMLFSHTTRIAGIAVFSHNFYRCGVGNGLLDDYDRLCTKLSNLRESEYYNPELVHRDIAQYRRNNQIEDVIHLRNKRLYVYMGLRNFLFTPGQSLNILNVFERYISNPTCIKTRVQDADLVLPSNNVKRPPCTELSPNTGFVGNCGFSGAYEALNHLLPGQVTREPAGGRIIQLQPLQQFQQSEFTTGISRHQMDSIGLLYVPTRCRGGTGTRCLLHFYFHGCLTGREFNGTRHIENSGFLELAELNDIIMVFPQAVSSLPENEIGCWDTFGISGPLYATKEGAQIKVVKSILDRVVGNGHSHSNTLTIPAGLEQNKGSSSSWSSSWSSSSNSYTPYRSGKDNTQIQF